MLRTGEPEFLSEIPDELLVKGAKDEEHLRITRELALRSAIIVPLNQALDVLNYNLSAFLPDATEVRSISKFGLSLVTIVFEDEHLLVVDNEPTMVHAVERVLASRYTVSTAATGDAALTTRILAAREQVVAGHGIAASLEEQDAATPTSVRLIRTGEEAGRLAPMLAHAARIESARAEQTVRSLVRILEPVMIILFGGVVALVAAALLQAVYSVRPA